MTELLRGFGAEREGERGGERCAVCSLVFLFGFLCRGQGVIPPGSLSSVCHTGLLEPGCFAYLHAQSHLSKSDMLHDRGIHTMISPPIMSLVFAVALPLVRSERGPREGGGGGGGVGLRPVEIKKAEGLKYLGVNGPV